MTDRRVLRIIGIVLAVVIVTVLGLRATVQRAMNSTVANAADVVFEIKRGEGFSRIAAGLRDQGILTNRYAFMALAYWRGDAKRVKSGEYLIRSGTRVDALLDGFVSGKVRQHAFAIIEGWNVRQVLAALAEQSALTSNLAGKSLEEIMPALGYPVGSAEGRFYPDTYFFPKGYTDTALLKRAAERMDVVLDREWQQRQENLPLQMPYQALILASLVEKETARSEERAPIAGVFIRRLQRGMRLQTDPTVVYGMGERYAGNISRQDLAQDTPYNTYTRSGLPPTPIAIPGAASLHAALHPEPGTSLYFVARGDGSHEFSSTLPEHQRAVARYQLNHRE